jgi:hypothetical protein
MRPQGSMGTRPRRQGLRSEHFFFFSNFFYCLLDNIEISFLSIFLLFLMFIYLIYCI